MTPAGGQDLSRGMGGALGQGPGGLGWDVSWADAVAVWHLGAIVFLVTGGFAAWKWPRVMPWHLATAGAIAAVNFAGADCPLTTLELRLRAAVGEAAYTGGFIGHYLVEPLYAPGITATVDRIIYAVVLVPNVVAYGGLALRHHRRHRHDRPRGWRRLPPGRRLNGC